MKVNKNSTLLTEEGYDRLTEKLKTLRGKLQQNREDMSRTAENGDLSENAGFMAAKESYQTHLNDINKLEEVLSEARVISPPETEPDQVDFGTQVTVRDLDEQEEYTYKIVGKYEARVQEGEISVRSPVAQGLLGKSPGEVATIDTPRGEASYEILEVKA